MTAMDDPEQRLSEALRARASQTGGRAPTGPPPPFPPSDSMRNRFPGTPTGTTRPRSPEPTRSAMSQVGWALGIALLAGAVLGCALALLSVLAPGLLPPLG